MPNSCGSNGFSGNRFEVSPQRFLGVKDLESAGFNVRDANLQSSAEDLKTVCVFCFTLLNESKSLSQHFTGILVATACDELFYE